MLPAFEPDCCRKQLPIPGTVPALSRTLQPSELSPSPAARIILPAVLGLGSPSPKDGLRLRGRRTNVGVPAEAEDEEDNDANGEADPAPDGVAEPTSAR